MKINVLIQPPIRRWQARIVDQLAEAGHDVSCAVGRIDVPLSLATTASLAVEKRLFGSPSSLFDTVSLSSRSASGTPDLTIALDDATPPSGDVIILLINGKRGANALPQAVARCSSPLVQIRARCGNREQELVRALLSIEHQDVLSHALHQVAARIVSLLLQAVRRFQQDVHPRRFRLSEPVDGRRLSPMRFATQGLARKIVRRLPGMRRGPPHWRVGFRFHQDADIRGGGWSGCKLTILPDDGRRFYADPMPFEHDGKAYVFFEDFSYGSGKGVIGLVEIGVDGPASTPRTVLEQPFHLSYPFIVRHGGEIYMLPEMSGARRVQVFRADPFPDRWVPDRVLLDDVVAADATPVLYEGRWWLFATLSDDGGSSWDQLCLFHAPDFFGPWKPHRDNPVLVDAGAARPAGAMWHDDGVLMRIAQDCRAGYGAGLALCRVDRLDDERYEQTVVSRFGPPDGYGADGVHTINRTRALETIDLRFPPLHRT